MINEGIDIENEENNEKRSHLTTKQVGRLLYEIGLERVAETMDDLVNASTEIEDNEKNA